MSDEDGSPWVYPPNGCVSPLKSEQTFGAGGGSSSIPSAAIGGNGACNSIGVGAGGGGTMQGSYSLIGVDYKSVTVRPPQTWGIEYDWGISFTYNGARVASLEKHGHVTTMFCKHTKSELAKELREFALAANEAATHLEMG